MPSISGSSCNLSLKTVEERSTLSQGPDMLFMLAAVFLIVAFWIFVTNPVDII